MPQKDDYSSSYDSYSSNCSCKKCVRVREKKRDCQCSTCRPPKIVKTCDNCSCHKCKKERCEKERYEKERCEKDNCDDYCCKKDSDDECKKGKVIVITIN